MIAVINCARSQFTKIYMLHVRKQIYALRSISMAKYALFAGHSKWANIRHIKAAKDAEKSTLFIKYARQIRLAIQDGGSADVALNSQLKSVIDEAVRKNMPMSTIKNNIQKYKDIKTDLKRYKLYVRWNQKVFVVCVLYTDNFAAVKMEMATVLRKGGASLLDAGHLFEEFGTVQATIDKSRIQVGSNLEDVATEDAITFGAEEVEIVDNDNGIVNFICRPFEIMAIRKAIETNGYVVDSAEHIYVPLNVVDLSKEELLAYEKFVAKLKEVSGMEEIFDNVNAV